MPRSRSPGSHLLRRSHFPAADRKRIGIGLIATTDAIRGDCGRSKKGEAQKVSAHTTLENVARGSSSKYPWWHPVVREGIFLPDPPAGSPSEVNVLSHRIAFGFGRKDGLSATGWHSFWGGGEISNEAKASRCRDGARRKGNRSGRRGGQFAIYPMGGCCSGPIAATPRSRRGDRGPSSSPNPARRQP